MDQYFFTIPFASLGDQTVPPLLTTTSGSISMQQGWGPDYALDPDTNPSALPIDRATTNWLLYAITQAVAALQQTGIPQWITAANNNGVSYPYAKYSTVRYSSTVPGVVFNTYVSVIDNNTDTPGTTSNWQPIASIVAAAADVVAGTSSALPVTPLTLKSYPGNSSQTFNVATATAAAMAPPASQVQLGTLNYAGAAGGSANALTATLTPAPTAYAAPLEVIVQVATTNTGAVTLNLNGLGATAVVGSAHAALQGNELVAGGLACFVYDASLSKFVLAWSTGGSEQVGNAVSSQQAVAFSQLTGVVGSARNLKATVAALAYTLAFTADQLIVGSALNGLQYSLASFNQTVNTATSGAGGMDTGSVPNSGLVAVYAIYNPTTNTINTLAQNVTSAAAPTVYAGGHMPTGYTASALLSIWPTNSSGQFVLGNQQGRDIDFVPINVVAISSGFPATGVATLVSLSAAVPQSAVAVRGNSNLNGSGTVAGQTIGTFVSPNANNVGTVSNQITATGADQSLGNYRINLQTAQQLYYVLNYTNVTLTNYTLSVTGYSI